MADRGGTAVGIVLGTVGYMAPEQVRGQPADHRADLFAFGCVLHEMVGGERAFTGTTPADTMSAILFREPADLEVTPGGLPPALVRIVRRCLEKSPALRFQSAPDLAFAIENATAPSSAAHSLVPPATARPAWAAGRVWSLALLVIGAAFGAATVT